MDFPAGTVDRNAFATAGDAGLIPALGRPHIVGVQSLSRVQLLATPWTAARQPPLSVGFTRQEMLESSCLKDYIEQSTAQDRHY